MLFLLGLDVEAGSSFVGGFLSAFTEPLALLVPVLIACGLLWPDLRAALGKTAEAGALPVVLRNLPDVLKDLHPKLQALDDALAAIGVDEPTRLKIVNGYAQSAISALEARLHQAVETVEGKSL